MLLFLIIGCKYGRCKNTWNVLNTVINKKMCPNELPKHFECNGEDISDTPIIANKFNTLFATIGPNIANTLPAVEDASIGDYMGEHNINSMFLTTVVESEVIHIVKLCKPKNSKDCDDISMYVISKVIVSIAKPLAHIFNLSFSCGVFPDHTNIAKMIPIFKNGKTEAPEDTFKNGGHENPDTSKCETPGNIGNKSQCPPQARHDFFGENPGSTNSRSSENEGRRKERSRFKP